MQRINHPKVEQTHWVEITDDRNGLNAAYKETEFRFRRISQVHVIIVIYTYLLKKIYRLKTPQLQILMQNNTKMKVIFKNCAPF